MPDHVLGPLASLVFFLAFLLAGTLLDPTSWLFCKFSLIKWRLYMLKRYWLWRLIGRRREIRNLGGTVCVVWERGTLCVGDSHHVFCPYFGRITLKSQLEGHEVRYNDIITRRYPMFKRTKSDGADSLRFAVKATNDKVSTLKAEQV